MTTERRYGNAAAFVRHVVALLARPTLRASRRLRGHLQPVAQPIRREQALRSQARPEEL